MLALLRIKKKTKSLEEYTTGKEEPRKKSSILTVNPVVLIHSYP